ncbi:MAG: sterol desaturase family protein [Saprospiraceae bacterium]
MNSLSKVHWIVPLIIFIPTISYLIYNGIVAKLPLFLMLGLYALGIAIWTAVEYSLHRFVFHFHPTSEFGKKIHFIFHGIHHDYPCDRLRLVMPPTVSIPLAIGFFFFFTLFLSAENIFPFFAGFLTGYLVYDMFHYMIHHVQVKGKLWNALKSHHLKHHYVDDNRGFGVSSKLWDLIIRTDFKEIKK